MKKDNKIYYEDLFVCGGCYPRSNTPTDKWPFRLVHATGEPPYLTNKENAYKLFNLAGGHLYKTNDLINLELVDRCGALPENLPAPETVKLSKEQTKSLEKSIAKGLWELI